MNWELWNFHSINEINLFQKKIKIVNYSHFLEITRFRSISGVSTIVPSDSTMRSHYYELEESSTSTHRYHESRDSRALRLTKFRLVSF